jgi:hypothetical protein
LVLAGLLPTIIEPARMSLRDWLPLAAGVGLLVVVIGRYARQVATVQVWSDARRIAWALVLALPYFVVWFYAYSYHYRLSFAIVPLMLLPAALILARWFPAQRVASWAVPRRRVYVLLVGLLCLPGTLTPLYHYSGGFDWLWSGEFPDDFSRLETFQLGVAYTARDLQRDIDARLDGQPATIIAPGLQRLPFFFPTHQVDILDTPTRLEQIADADYYIFTQEAAWLYEENDQPAVNPVTGAMFRNEIMQPVTAHADSTFFSRVFALRNPERRFREPRQMQTPDVRVHFGDFARFAGYRYRGGALGDDSEQSVLNLVWEALEPTSTDYVLMIHLRDPDGQTVAVWDGRPAQGPHAYYGTHFWQRGEYVTDRRQLPLPEGVAPGDDYRLVIGFYHFDTLERVAVTVGGQPAGEEYTLDLRLTVE